METHKVKIHRCSIRKEFFSNTPKSRKSFLGRVRDKINTSRITIKEKNPDYDLLHVRPLSGTHQKCMSYDQRYSSPILTPELSKHSSFQYLNPSPGDSYDENSEDDL